MMTDSPTDQPPDFPVETTEAMVAAINQRMPFGKYMGTPLLDIPEYYLVWFKQRGFPTGKLGTQMALVYEIKLNGLEKLVRPLMRSMDSAESETGEVTGQGDMPDAEPS